MLSTISPRSTAPPPESTLSSTYHGADLADAFIIGLPDDATRDVRRLAESVLADPPGWVRSLMQVRDGVMGRLGVKTARQIRAATATSARDRIDFFPVISTSDQEIVVGEDDRHLDFRTSILVRSADPDQADTIIVTTVVRCHNLLGRLYLAVIRRFHVVIVKTYLRRAARGWPLAAP
jgi:hypothetical protein